MPVCYTAGDQRQLEVSARIKNDKRVTDFTTSGGAEDIRDALRKQETQRHFMRARYEDYGNQLLLLKLPEFLFSEIEIEDIIAKARKHKSLIIDLRGNPGGSVDTLKYLVGGMFDKDVKIADRIGRKEVKTEVAKTSHNPFTGKLVVLVDARSASAAELFARVVQIEERGLVVGDRTSGSVMEARHYTEKTGTDIIVVYGASITNADLIMTDGKSLEHRGVIPDELFLPSAQDIADGRDPVLAHAAELVGVRLSPEEAGKAFPFEWPPL